MKRTVSPCDAPADQIGGKLSGILRRCSGMRLPGYGSIRDAVGVQPL